MPEETPDQWRIRVAVRCCILFRDALEKNGNRYSGSLVPNLTSITDVLTLDHDLLRQNVALTPALDPDIPFTPSAGSSEAVHVLNRVSSRVVNPVRGRAAPHSFTCDSVLKLGAVCNCAGSYPD